MSKKRRWLMGLSMALVAIFGLSACGTTQYVNVTPEDYLNDRGIYRSVSYDLIPLEENKDSYFEIDGDNIRFMVMSIMDFGSRRAGNPYGDIVVVERHLKFVNFELPGVYTPGEYVSPVPRVFFDDTITSDNRWDEVLWRKKADDDSSIWWEGDDEQDPRWRIARRMQASTTGEIVGKNLAFITIHLRRAVYEKDAEPILRCRSAPWLCEQK